MSVITGFSEFKGKNGKNYLSCSSENIFSSALGSDMDNSQTTFRYQVSTNLLCLNSSKKKDTFFFSSNELWSLKEEK